MTQEIFAGQSHSTSSLFTRIVLFGTMSMLAVGTLITFAAQWFGLAFVPYAWLTLAAMVSTLVIAVVLMWRNAQIQNRDSGVLLGLVALCLAGAVLAVILHRPDADDFLYVPDAVYHLQHPDAAMDFVTRQMYLPECIIFSPGWSSAPPLGYLEGALAYFSHLPYLVWYYELVPAWFGVLIPLAAFYVLLQFESDTRAVLVGTTAIMFILLLSRDTDRTFGNFAFTRLFQSKSMVLSVGIPAFMGSVLAFWRVPSLHRWLGIFAIATACAGASIPSMLTLPPLLIALALALIVISADKRRSILLSVLGSLALAFLVAVALFIHFTSTLNLGLDSWANVGIPADFWGHLAYFINPSLPITVLGVVFFTVAGLFVTKGKQRVFFAVWIIAVVVLFLNPLVAPPLINYVTTPNIYWRLFYIYPYPLLAGIVAIAGYAYVQKRSAGARTIIYAASGVAALFLILVSFWLTLQRGSLWIGAPDYTLPPALRASAEKIVATAPQGAMLAPSDLAGVVNVLDSNFPQISIRHDALRVWMQSCQMDDQARARLGAEAFTTGDPTGLTDFAKTLDAEPIQSVVFNSQLLGDQALADLLKSHGLLHQEPLGTYTLVWK